MRKRVSWYYWIGAIILIGCASTPPLDVRGVDPSFRLTDAVQRGQGGVGRRVLWGGLIVRSENLPQRTELEVLGYTLDKDQQPNTDSTPQNRFLIEKAGYLETKDYAPGRVVTVVGPVQDIREGKVDRFTYQFPVVTAEQLRLWPRPRDSESPVHFGFGVGFGL